jgi:hypothetical protein
MNQSIIGQFGTTSLLQAKNWESKRESIRIGSDFRHSGLSYFANELNYNE